MSLCQRGAASCAACCGIYNVADPGRAAVRAELARHTRALAAAPRTPEGFRAAARALEAGAPATVFPSIRVCMLAGYLDAEETRVGCLAHPAATGGADLRACGVYDVETCEAFLCPSHARLGEADAALVEAVADPVLYGLVVTDAGWVRAALGAVEARAGRPVGAADLADPRAAAALRGLLALKEELAPGSDGLFGAFRKGAGADAGPPEGSEAERLAAALGADERSGNDAEALGDEAVRRAGRAAAALRTSSPPRPQVRGERGSGRGGERR